MSHQLSPPSRSQLREFRLNQQSSHFPFPSTRVETRQNAKVLSVGFLSMVLWLLVIPCGKLLAQAESNPSIDFVTDVLPILESRCFECHSGGQDDGDLRLDTKLNALRGGHTGNPVLGTSAADSELIQRISSDEDGYRMPKDGNPLSQQQIETLTNWIDAGAVWPIGNAARKSNQETAGGKQGSFIDWLAEKYLLTEQPKFRYAAIAFAAFLALLICMLAYRFLAWRTIKNSQVVGETLSNRTVCPTWTTFSVVATIFGLLAAIGFQYGQIETLNQEKLGTTTVGQTTTSPDGESSFEFKPEVPKPMHPPRLGGVYYRGNDERSPDLFNGGFYRTAELLVQLVDRDGAPVNFGNQTKADELAIQFKATRASGATRQLFSPRTMSSAFISAQFKSSETEDDRRMLESQDEGEAWGVTFPLGLKSVADLSSSEERFTGTIYVFYGPLDRNRIHYAINYSINLRDGQVLEDSEVWMGSAYNLGGRVIYPRGDQIALDHWFDFRPIPEIDGKNSENPTLLGLPEHLPAKADSAPLGDQ